MLVVGVYNALDLLARLRLSRLQRAVARLSGRPLLGLCVLRLLLPALIYASVRPQWVGLGGGWGNGVILAAVAALALSKGYLATLSMMHVARLPPALREDAVYVAVAALYLGLASGATVSLAAGHLMRLTEMRCE